MVSRKNQTSIKKRGKNLLKHPVIRCFVGDQDVVGVALSHTGIGDPYEPCFPVHVVYRPGSRVTHRRFEPSDKLVDDLAHIPDIGGDPFHTFRYELGTANILFLEIPVA